MKASDILNYAVSKNIEIWADGDQLRIDAPRSTLTPALRDALRECKPELMVALKRSSDDKRYTLFPPHKNKNRRSKECAGHRVNYVSCGSCAHWTGSSPCDAGYNTSGDLGLAKGIHLCGRHVPRRAQ